MASDFLATIVPGDHVLRLVSTDKIPNWLMVRDIDADYIYCEPLTALVPWPKDQCWKFRRDNGIEVDEELGWGIPDAHGRFSPTGSYLVEARKPTLDTRHEDRIR